MIFSRLYRELDFFWWRLRRLWAYCRFLWKDQYEGGWEVSLRLFGFSLERMRKHIAQHNILANADRVCHEIRIGELLIERILADDYTTEGWAKLSEKYPFDFKTINNLPPEHWAEVKRLGERNEYMVKQDEAYLAKILVKHLRGWWD